LLSSPADEGNGGSWQNLDSVRVVEPRIELVARQLEALLRVVEFTNNGQPVRVRGFRLRNLNDWVVDVTADPSRLLSYLSWRCGVSCVFCYQKGTPPACASRGSYAHDREIETRLRYSSPDSGTALFEQAFFNTDEVLTRPGILEYLGRIRAMDRKSVLRLTTNGTMLTERFVECLAALSPISPTLSLNSSTPATRARFMKDPRPETAINSLPLLKRHRIPYVVSIVPWPGVPLSDVERTILYADAHDPLYVKMVLPGFTQYSPESLVFDTDAHWTKVTRAIRRLRPRVTCPILIQPALYEDNLFDGPGEGLKVTGTLKNSPARAAGLRAGSYIRKVNGIPVDSASQLRILLALFGQETDFSVQGKTEDESLRAILVYCRDSSNGSVRMDVRDRGTHTTVDFPLSDAPATSYPYRTWVNSLRGIVAGANTVTQKGMAELIEIVVHSSATEVLFLTSRLLKPHLDWQLRRKATQLKGTTIHTEVPVNRFFGGNIMLGDLLVVEDFVGCVREWTEREDRVPDLVIIPSTPFHAKGTGWGRDLTGQCYLAIERRLGVPVKLLQCEMAS
jgi:hypothetical protein